MDEEDVEREEGRQNVDPGGKPTRAHFKLLKLTSEYFTYLLPAIGLYNGALLEKIKLCYF